MLCQLSFAQTFTGTVYSKTSTLEGVSVKNMRTQRITRTDAKGAFAIGAAVQDSLLFQFFSHKDQVVVLREQDRTDFVVELVPEVTMLDEVFLEGPARFNEARFTAQFKSDLANDIALHPEKYAYSNNPNGNLDLVSIGRELWKVIKKDEPVVHQPQFTPITRIKHEQYFSLLEVDAIINDEFLIEILHIPAARKIMFIDFCISKKLQTDMLKPENKFFLIDQLITISKEFLELPEGE